MICKKSEYNDVLGSETSDDGNVMPKFKKGDHVWARQPKELAGRTGYVTAVDTRTMMYDVNYSGEMWKVLESDLELVDTETEKFKTTAFRPETFTSPVENIIEAWKKMGDEMRRFRIQYEEKCNENLSEEPQNNIKEAVEAMYHHTKKANVAYYWMVGTVILTYTLAGIGRIAAMLAFASLLFSLGQNMWQGVAIERFIRRLDSQHKTHFDYYPDHISNGGWILYIMKMLLAIASIVLMLFEV